MKKILSLFVSFAMLASFGLVSYAADSMPDLLFDMDLSECSETTVSVTDESGSGKVTSISYGNASDSPLPGYGVNTYGTPYLIFDTEGNTAEMNGSVNVLFNEAIPDKDALSYSAWVCEVNGANDANHRRNKSLCSFGDESSSAKDFVLQHTSGASLQVQADNYFGGARPNVISGLSSYTNQWVHLTVTYEWTQTDATNNLWSCTITGYVNGAASATATRTNVNRKAWNEIYSSGKAILTVGGDSSNSGNRSFPGYIADFKLYDGALTADQVRSDYLASATGYMPTVSATHSLASYSRGDSSFTITFDDPVNDATLSTVMLKDAENAELNIAYVSYDEATNTATYSIFDHLTPNASYTLDLSGVKDDRGLGLSRSTQIFTAQDGRTAAAAAPVITYKNTEGTIVSGLSQAASAEISVDVTNSGAEELTFYCALMIKDSEGRAVKMPLSDGVPVAAGDNDTVSLTVTGLDATGSASLVVWCRTESGVFYPIDPAAPLS